MEKNINQRQLELLKEVLFLEQDELHLFNDSFLSEFYEKDEIFDAWGEGMYFKGDIPVLLVAHMDTVHMVKPTEETLFYDREKDVMWCPNGLGADCRAGVFNILDIVSKGYKPHIMLTWDEEIGGVGASKLMQRWGLGSYTAEALLVQEGMRNVNFAIQFDRHGYSEAVYYDLDNQDFENYISSFGYYTQIGSYTDICEICPEYGFAGVNVAAGYMNEHKSNEILMIEEMMETQRKVINILENQIKEPKFYEYVEAAFSYEKYYGSWGGSAYKGVETSWYDAEDEYSKAVGYASESQLIEDDETADNCFSCGERLQSGFNWSASMDEYQSTMCYDCRLQYWGESGDVPFQMIQETRS